MSKRALVLFMICGCSLIVTYACQDSSPAGGFTVTTSEAIEDPIFGIPITAPVSGIQVIGNYITAIAGGTPEGYVLNFTQYSTGGSLFVTAGKNPAWWNLAESNGPCGGQSVNSAIVQPQRTANLVCLETSLSSSAVNPTSFNGLDPPQIKVTVQPPMSFTYGPPRLTIVSSGGVVFYDQTPDSYTSTSLTVYAGSMPSLNNDVYYVVPSQHLADGSMGSAGVTTISVFGNPYKTPGGTGCPKPCALYER